MKSNELWLCWNFLGNKLNKTFQESCPVTSLSSCENIRRWKLFFQKRRLFIHVNTVEIKGDFRGFLAGYMVYKKGRTTCRKPLLVLPFRSSYRYTQNIKSIIKYDQIFDFINEEVPENHVMHF